MTLNLKGLAALVGGLVLATAFTAAPADACWKRHYKSADGGAVYGWKHKRHRKHWRHWKHAEMKDAK
jgi:hypothetical protein